MGKVRFAMVALLVAMMFVGVPSSFTDCNALVQSLTYHAFHVNAFHLAANCLGVLLLFRRFSWGELATAYIIACVAYPFSSVPVLGISNVLFAVMGLRTPSLGNAWWRKRETMIFLLVTVLMLLVPKVSALTHIISFALGTMVSQIRIWIRKIDDIYEKAGKK